MAVGVDEVGRGSVAGPLTVCAVPSDGAAHLGHQRFQKLTPARAASCSVKIAEVATGHGFCHIAPADIDEMGMAPRHPRALPLRVRWPIRDLNPDCVLMDGNPLGAVPNERRG